MAFMVMRSYSFSMHKQIVPLMIILPPLHMMITFFIVLVSIFSIIAFLCGSHNFPGSQRRKEERTARLGGGGGGGDQTKLQSSLGTKALLMIKMISWRKMQRRHDQECCSRSSSSSSSGDDDEEAAVWKRTIILGERCRPLEFSGKILYDSHGNPLHGSL